MKGHIPTPADLAEKMVRRLFRNSPPDSADRILYPGCGTAPFAAAVERICNAENWKVTDGVGVESDPEYIS
jgi:adenine-specific DNA-methyltransferase